MTQFAPVSSVAAPSAAFFGEEKSGREDLGGASIDAGGGGKLGTSRNFGRARVVTPDPGFVALKSPAPRRLN